MHNHALFHIPLLLLRRAGPILGAAALCLLTAAAVLGACARPEKDAGSADSLSSDKPLLREYRGAQLYFLRQGGDVIALWGISPLGSGEAGKVRCFVQDRTDREFRGERLVFVDPCRGAWWAYDGRFLGYTDDPVDAPAAGPPLVRIPASVRDGRVILDDGYLRCLQNRQPSCGE